jgi:hypothetical protein
MRPTKRGEIPNKPLNLRILSGLDDQVETTWRVELSQVLKKWRAAAVESSVRNPYG